ncbi:MAG TPA: 3-hydroxybutyryl-CoA dehydrogenase [Bdellovibrionota bacterium]|jgi:3-hydroxybutyryl-CoA dehydrogenase|nr:3-hydroxybutyryl-CoA dehydrogenase [Bdellovibrionota bacterium]
MKFQKVGVLGAGQMGIGIAQTAAQSGVTVLLADQNLELAEKGKAKIAGFLKKLIEKGKLTEADQQKTLGAIQPVRGMEDFASAPLVIEAVTENPTLKFELFRKLDQACAPGTILASNTSSISITTIAAQTKRPEKVAGIHFMNPVPVMKLVEGIRGLQTSDETFRTVREFSESLGKTFVEASDQPGFAVNRILMPMINEAVTALHEGVASASDIDVAMKLGTNQPMGPLELADFIGLDTCLAIMNVLHEGLGDSKYRPSPLLKKYVAAGWLGRKSGRGFHRYDRV